MSSSSPPLSPRTTATYALWAATLTRAPSQASSPTSSVIAAAVLPEDHEADAQGIRRSVDSWRHEPMFDMMVAPRRTAWASPPGGRRSLGSVEHDAEHVPPASHIVPILEAPGEAAPNATPQPAQDSLLPLQQAPDAQAPSAPEQAAQQPQALLTVPSPTMPRRRQLRAINSMPVQARRISRKEVDAPVSHSDIDEAMRDGLLARVAKQARSRRSVSASSESSQAPAPTHTPPMPEHLASGPRTSSEMSPLPIDSPTHYVLQAMHSLRRDSSASASSGPGPQHAGSRLSTDELADDVGAALPSPNSPASSASVLPRSPASVTFSQHSHARHLFEPSPQSSPQLGQGPSPVPRSPLHIMASAPGPATPEPPWPRRRLMGQPPVRTNPAFRADEAQHQALIDSRGFAHEANAIASRRVSDAQDTPITSQHVFDEVVRLHKTSWHRLLLSQPRASRVAVLAATLGSIDGLGSRLGKQANHTHPEYSPRSVPRLIRRLRDLTTQANNEWAGLWRTLDRPFQRAERQAVLHAGVQANVRQLEALAKLPCEVVRHSDGQPVLLRDEVRPISVLHVHQPLQIRLFGEKLCVPAMALTDLLPLPLIQRDSDVLGADINSAMWLESTRHWRALYNFGVHLIGEHQLQNELSQEVRGFALSSSASRRVMVYKDLEYASEHNMARYRGLPEQPNFM